jgi:uncharacterized protein with HEPN domain
MCVAAADLVGRGRDAIEADPVLWMALERVVEIAGEAASQLSDETCAQYPAVPWRELSATRVILAHAYHRLDLDLLWDIAAADLPELARALGPLAEGPAE